MKYFFKLLISFIIFMFYVTVYAEGLTYSEWSETKPNVEDFIIQSEDRFLFYKENEVNVEYLRKDSFGNKLYDLEDSIFSEESELLDQKPDELEGRVITEVEEPYDNANNIKKARFTFDIGVNLSEIVVLDKKKNKISYSSDYDFIQNDILDDYNFVKEVVITFDNVVSINEFSVSFYYDSDNENDLLQFDYLDSNDRVLYTINYDIKAKPFSINNWILSMIPYNTIKYKYYDTLYKTYEVEKEYLDDYYKEMDGYIKDESSKKTFYRYITNDYVIVKGDNTIVENPETYCKKSFCSLVYLTKKEEQVVEEEPEVEEVIEEVPEEIEIPINPKTIDNVYYFFIFLIVSLIIIAIMYKEKLRKIYLVLSKRFKKV